MKFKKTALALAVAAVAAAPMAQAEVKLSGGVAIFLITSDDLRESAAGAGDAASGDPRLVGDDSTLNVTATHVMDNGLTGYGVVRFDGALTDSSPSADGIRVGIKGGFGDFRIGDTFNPLEYGQLANDSLKDVGANIEEQSIGYQGTFGPVTVGAVWAPELNSQATGHAGPDDSSAFGAKLSFGGFTVGAGAGTVADSDRVSAGASFGFAGVTLAVAFKDFDTFETIGLQAKYGIGNFDMGLTFESVSDDLSGAGSQDGDTLIRFDAGYGLGGGMRVSTRINVFTDDTSDIAGNAFDENRDDTNIRLMLGKTF